ncbi:MAG: IbrB-like domain-containing protein [Bacteroidota bacterium]
MIQETLEQYKDCSFQGKVEVFNKITQELYDWLGMKHPALNVQLVPSNQVEGNEYNPNKVAPPEMRLLRLSMKKDGVTMPVVIADQDKKKKPYVVVDGFHRTSVVQNDKQLNNSLGGYIPVSRLNKNIENRISATVRHNMARGTHQVELSSKLVVLLRKHNWTDARIGKELGMEPDEVLRLKQITGLAEAFADREFSKSWE